MESYFNLPAADEAKARCQIVPQYKYLYSPRNMAEATAYGKTLIGPRVSSDVVKTPFPPQSCPYCDPASKRPLCDAAIKKLQRDAETRGILMNNLIKSVDRLRKELHRRNLAAEGCGPYGSSTVAAPLGLPFQPQEIDEQGIPGKPTVYLHHKNVISPRRSGSLVGGEATFEALMGRKREEFSDVRYRALQSNLESFRGEALQLYEEAYKMYHTSLGQCHDLQERLSTVEEALATEKSHVKRLNVSIRESELSNTKLRSEIQQLSEQRITRDTDISRLKSLTDESQNKVHHIERENVELKLKLETVAQGCRDAKQLSLQLQHNLDSALQEKERLERAAAASEATYGGQSSEYKAMVAQLREEAQLMRSALNEAKASAEVIKEELEATKSQNAILSAKLKRQVADSNVVQSEATAALEAEISRLNAKLKSRESEKNALELEKNTLVQQLEKQLKAIAAKLELVEMEKTKAVQKLQQENEEINKKLTAMAKQAKILQKRSEESAIATTAGNQSPFLPSLALNQIESPAASPPRGSDHDVEEKAKKEEVEDEDQEDEDEEELESPKGGFFAAFGL